MKGQIWEFAKLREVWNIEWINDSKIYKYQSYDDIVDIVGQFRREEGVICEIYLCNNISVAEPGVTYKCLTAAAKSPAR